MISTIACMRAVATHSNVTFSDAATGLAENPVAPAVAMPRQQGRLTPPLRRCFFRHNTGADRERLPVTLLSPANGLLRYAVSA
jgi:hypothetical protein